MHCLLYYKKAEQIIWSAFLVIICDIKILLLVLYLNYYVHTSQFRLLSMSLTFAFDRSRSKHLMEWAY